MGRSRRPDQSDRCIVAVASREYSPYLELATPSFIRFAAKWGYDVNLYPNLPKMSERGDSWNKIPVVVEEFKRGYEKILLLDSDVVVMQVRQDIPWEDIANAGCNHGIVAQNVDDYNVPNTGVMAITYQTLPLLLAMWEFPTANEERYANDPWMEQSAYMEILGWNPSYPTTPIHPPSKESLADYGCYLLPQEWNVSKDNKELIPNAIIRHASGRWNTPDKRMRLMLRWSDEVNEQELAEESRLDIIENKLILP